MSKLCWTCPSFLMLNWMQLAATVVLSRTKRYSTMLTLTVVVGLVQPVGVVVVVPVVVVVEVVAVQVGDEDCVELVADPRPRGVVHRREGWVGEHCVPYVRRMCRTRLQRPPSR